MNSSPVFSVLIPTYNRCRLVQKSAESVLAQTYSKYEVIIIDDGSTDETPNVISEFIKAHGSAGRIRYLRQQQCGKSVALNRALAEAKGDWISFLDSDDLWLPDKLEWQVRAITQFGDCGACFTDATYCNNPHLSLTAFQRAGKKYREGIGRISRPVRFILDAPHGVHIPTLAVHKSVIEKAGGFDPDLRVCEDTDFLFRVGLATGFSYVNRPLVQIDRSMKREVGLIELLGDDEYRLTMRQRMFEKWLPLSEGQSADVRSGIRAHLQAVHRGWANYHVARAEYRQARRAIVTAARYRCTPPLLAKWMSIALLPRVMRKLVLKRAEKLRSTHVPA